MPNKSRQGSVPVSSSARICPWLTQGPSDRAPVIQLDGTARPDLRRTRSYNLSQSVSGVPYGDILSYIPSYQKLSEVRRPPPSLLFNFIEVHEGGILDALFGLPPPGSPSR